MGAGVVFSCSVAGRAADSPPSGLGDGGRFLDRDRESLDALGGAPLDSETLLRRGAAVGTRFSDDEEARGGCCGC